MTCVTALIHEGKIHMAADSASGGQFIFTLGEGTAKIGIKTISVNAPGGHPEQCLIGISGSARMGQLALYVADVPQLPKDSTTEAMMRWLVKDVCGSIRQMLKTEGDLSHGNSGERKPPLPGQILLGVRTKLYIINANLEVLQVDESYAAIGSGAAHAVGVLFATKDIDPQSRLEMALEAAEHWNANVRRPFHFLTV